MPLRRESPTDEQEFLDRVFEHALECLEDGQPISTLIDEFTAVRPALHDEIERAIDMARRLGATLRIGGPNVAASSMPRETQHLATLGYELIEPLGEGGMGAVWLARQHKLADRCVAVKLLPASMRLVPRLRSRFRREAQAIAKLRHPNIVNVYDVMDDEQVSAYAMEWIEGTTLAQVIDSAKGGDASKHGVESSMSHVRRALGSESPDSAMPSDRSYIVFVCRVGAAIARALASVHRAGLVHRDVKPSNILLRRDGTPLLSDFGLVRDPDSTLVTLAEESGAARFGAGFAGTAAFAAPEQLRANGEEVDGRADVYALGATLYYALALRLPCTGRTNVDVLRQIDLGLSPLLRKINPKLPRDVQTIVAKAMDPDRSQRYETAEELADDLERLLNLQPIKARPAGVLVRTVKMLRRRRAMLAAAIVGGVMSLSIVALLLVYLLAFPTWSKAQLDEARMTLLDPNQSDILYSVLVWKVPAGGSPLSKEVADRALMRYDAAIRWAPFDGEVRTERAVVHLARELSTRNVAGPVIFAYQREFPLTTAYAQRLNRERRDFETRVYPDFTESDFRAASLDDLRYLGLLSLLCGDPRTAMNAWAAHDLRTEPNDFAEAWFGMAYLITEQYGRAYPRLRRAVEAFPNAGFLTVYLAEAACQCGDVEKAQQWLDEARVKARLDQFDGLKRVQALIHAAAGRIEDAHQLYEELWEQRDNAIALHQFGQFLEARGDLDRALITYCVAIQHEFPMPLFRQRFMASCERWWNQLPAERKAALWESMKQVVFWTPDERSILPMYGHSLVVLGEAADSTLAFEMMQNRLFSESNPSAHQPAE